MAKQYDVEIQFGDTWEPCNEAPFKHKAGAVAWLEKYGSKKQTYRITESETKDGNEETQN